MTTVKITAEGRLTIRALTNHQPIVHLTISIASTTSTAAASFFQEASAFLSVVAVDDEADDDEEDAASCVGDNEQDVYISFSSFYIYSV